MSLEWSIPDQRNATRTGGTSSRTDEEGIHQKVFQQLPTVGNGQLALLGGVGFFSRVVSPARAVLSRDDVEGDSSLSLGCDNSRLLLLAKMSNRVESVCGGFSCTHISLCLNKIDYLPGELLRYQQSVKGTSWANCCKLTFGFLLRDTARSLAERLCRWILSLMFFLLFSRKNKVHSFNFF